MDAQILDHLEPGTDEWHSERLVSFCASEAPVMMADAPWETRDGLLLRKKTGLAKGVSYFTQRIFDNGHRVEASARPFAEKLIGDDLHQKVFVRMVEGMRLLASLDGVTLPFYEIIWECKQYNAELYAIVSSGGELEGKHYWQLEHQMLVVGDCQCIFACSDGTEARYAQMVYESRPERRAKLIAHWHQFEADLAVYVLPPESAPKAIAEPVASLPSITYKIDFTKGIAIDSNLEPFKLAAQALVEKSKDELVTDQDFANAKARVDACTKAEQNIDSLIERVLGDLGNVNTFKTDMENIRGWIRESRLNQEKKIKNRNDTRRVEIVTDGKTALELHINAINAKLAPIKLPFIVADFAAAIKGKSNFENMISAVNNKLAEAKIQADALYTKMDSNITLVNELAIQYLFLFADLQSLCTHEPEPLRAIVLQRIADHTAEQNRLAEVKRVEDERVAAVEKQRLADLETKRIADEAAEALRISEAAKVVTQEIPSIAELPFKAEQVFAGDEYDQMMGAAETVTPKFEQGFNTVFSSPAKKSAAQPLVSQKTQYQMGMLDGLDLALAIFMKHGAMGFSKAIEDFIESDAIPESKAA